MGSMKSYLLGFLIVRVKSDAVMICQNFYSGRYKKKEEGSYWQVSEGLLSRIVRID